MTKSILFTTILGMMSVTAANAQLRPEIIGGQQITIKDAAAKSTVLLYVEDQGGAGICTGSLIASDLIVTAAHCVQTQPKNMSVFFVKDIADVTPRNANQVGRAVVGMIAHPIYARMRCEAPNRENKDCGDIALIRFWGTTPAGYGPAKTFTTAELGTLRRGQKVTLAGFGVSDAVAGTGDGVLRKVDTTISNPTYGRTEVVFEQKFGKGACFGDSGGPAFIEKAGQLYLMGVTSRGPGDCDIEAVYTKVEIYQPWIEAQSKVLRAKSFSPQSRLVTP